MDMLLLYSLYLFIQVEYNLSIWLKNFVYTPKSECWVFAFRWGDRTVFHRKTPMDIFHCKKYNSIYFPSQRCNNWELGISLCL